MVSKLIPVMRPILPTLDEYEKYLLEIDQVGIYSNRGPLVTRLEQRYAQKLGISDPSLVVLCSNATLAIQGFLQISDAETWHVPSFTFVATVHAAIQSGKKVVLEDIDPKTWMISPTVITDIKNAGVVPVLPFGAPFNSNAFRHIDHVLVDAAASIGGASAWINDIKESWAAVFSLHATKSFGIGEGGLIVLGSQDMADEFRSWINFGFSGTREAQRLGTNAKLSEVQAAVGLAVIDSWEIEEAEWNGVRCETDEISKNLGLGKFDVIPKGTLSPYWIISHSDEEVISRIQIACAENKIETRKWWAEGCHRMPAFSSLNSSLHAYSSTGFLGRRYLGLPFHRDMTPATLGQISAIVERLGIDGQGEQNG
jgi:dTDP-4-amino-4,6-dideoxygalactose transaminase